MNSYRKEDPMKFTVTLSLIFALAAPSFVLAQSGGMKHVEMKDMDMQKCMDMKGTSDMKGMDMKDMQNMDMQKCKEMMNGKDKKAENAKAVTHKAVAVVKEVDAVNGKVTLAHEPIQSLKWPAMTMSFAVKDKSLFAKLKPGKKVHVDLVQQGSDYVVTAVQ